MAQGALTFGAATSDNATGASQAALTLDPFTILVWVFVTTLTNQRVIWSNTGTTTGNRLFRLSGTTGDVQLAVVRATTNTLYTTNNTPLSATSTWVFLAATFNSAGAAGQIVNIYKGTLGTLATECTYTAPTDGAGAVAAYSGGGTPRWGNGNSGTVAIQGRECVSAAFGTEMSQADIQSWQREPRNSVAGVTAVEFKRFGKDGADGIDYTGNGNSTVTGATQSDGAPIGGTWTRQNGIYRRAA